MKQLRSSIHATFYVMLMTVFIILLVGCGTMQRPQSPEDYLQSAKAQVGAAYRTIGDLKAQGQITADEGGKYFARVEQIEKQVATTEQLVRGGADISTVQGGLSLALAGLLTIQTELKSRQQPK